MEKPVFYQRSTSFVSNGGRRISVGIICKEMRSIDADANDFLAAAAAAEAQATDRPCTAFKTINN